MLDDRVLFDFNRAKIRGDASGLLRAVAKLIEEHADFTKIQIVGHADEIGSAEYNRKLSQARAESVRRALIALGLAPERLVAEGVGKTQPRVRGRDELSRQQNRRVEFIIEREREETERP